MKKIIKLKPQVGVFAENKEIAKRIRQDEILPNLANSNEIVLDFNGVEGATQSFVHALVSDPIRQFGNQAFELLYFKNTNLNIQKIISIVYRYLQESLNDNGGQD